MLEEMLSIISSEIYFYKNRNNEDWSIDKNEGFKLGLEYCKKILLKVGEKLNDNDK